MTMLWQNVILETCASNLFFAKFFSSLLSQQCEPETPTRQSCCVVRKRWWFRNFPPPYSLIYFQNPTDSSFIKRNDFSPLDSSSHQGIEQSVWILMLLYWHTLCYFIYNNRYWCSFFCVGFWYTSILISLYRIPPRENKRSYHFVLIPQNNEKIQFTPSYQELRRKMLYTSKGTFMAVFLMKTETTIGFFPLWSATCKN